MMRGPPAPLLGVPQGRPARLLRRATFYLLHPLPPYLPAFCPATVPFAKRALVHTTQPFLSKIIPNLVPTTDRRKLQLHYTFCHTSPSRFTYRCPGCQAPTTTACLVFLRHQRPDHPPPLLAQWKCPLISSGQQRCLIQRFTRAAMAAAFLIQECRPCFTLGTLFSSQ